MTELTRALVRLDAQLTMVALGGLIPDGLAGLEHAPEPLHPPTNMGWAIVGLPRAAAAAGVDVIHAPAYTGPVWSRVPVVLTIHDVSYARHPEWYPYRRDGIRRAFYRRCARAASHILTDSLFSAAEIAEAYGIDRGLITVAPLGVDPSFGSTQSAPGSLPAQVTAPFLLHVGDLHERRNLAVVVRAMVRIRLEGWTARPVSLVLAGADRGSGERLRALAVDAGVPDLVVQLGAVSEADLHALYGQAIALVYPSLYEGFGLPVLEAMAAGLPVIASRAASMPEILGDAGLLIDPLDDGAWAQAVADVASDETRRTRMRSAGLLRAAAFTWARTARATLAVYTQAVGQ